MTILSNYALTESFDGCRVAGTPTGLSINNPTGNNLVTDKMQIADWGGNIGPAMKINIAQTDTPLFGGIRGEISAPYETFDTQVYYAFKVFIPEDFPEGPLFSNFQIHDAADAEADPRSPTFIFATDGKYVYCQRALSMPTEAQGRATIGTAPLVKGRWVQCCFRAFWTKSTTNQRGFYEFVYDGNIIFKEYRRTTSYDDVIGPYAKIGLYDIPHTPSFGQRTAYFKELVRGDSAETYMTMIGMNPKPRTLPSID